jgi:Spy/CpxP family protein refolding chaperone
MGMMTDHSIRFILVVGTPVTRPVRRRHFYHHTRIKASPNSPMKTFTKITLLTLGLASTTLPFLAAADTTAPAVPANPAPHARFPVLRAMVMRRMAMTRQVAKKLGLSAGQIAQLKSLRQQTAATIKDIRTDSTLTREQKKTQAVAALQNARTQMRGVLTADQQAQLDQIRKHRLAARNGSL